MKIFVKPNAGCTMYHPGTKVKLADEGEQVEMSPFWQRRINVGDVSVISQEKPQEQPKKSSGKKQESNGG